MRRRVLEAGIRKWLAAASGLDIGNIKRAPYDGVRLEGLRITYQPISAPRLGHDDHRMHADDDDTGEPPLELTGQRELVVQVTVYGTGEIDGEQVLPEDIAEQIAIRYQMPDLAELAGSLGFTVGMVRDITEQATLMDAAHEERAVCELVVRYVMRAKTYPGYIDNVELESRYIEGDDTVSHTFETDCS